MKKSLFGLILLAILIALGWHTVGAQLDKNRYFADTGHHVTGEFLTYYESFENPTAAFGSPITDIFQDEKGNLKQYFEHSLFELDIRQPDELKVQRAHLGELLHQENPGQPFPLPRSTPHCKFFSETGFQVCAEFLDFFEAHGGVAVFGFPVSEIEFQEGMFVQYFQLARLERHPELAPAQRIQLSDLGRIYFERAKEDARLLAPSPNRGAIMAIDSIQARVFVEIAVTDLSGQQVINVIVLNQNLQGVKDADVSIEVQLPEGETLACEPAPLKTDAKGLASCTLAFLSHKVGEARVKATVQYGKLTESAATSFRVWH